MEQSKIIDTLETYHGGAATGTLPSGAGEVAGAGFGGGRRLVARNLRREAAGR